ncbi:HET-domain-containing protein [Apiospora sp. TS-2023a]
MTPTPGAQLCHSCRNIFDRRSLYGINPATETCHEGCECSACRIYPTTHCIHESLAALRLAILAGCWVCSSLPSLDAWAAHSRLYVVIDQLSGGTRRTPLRPFFYYLEFRVTEDATGASESITAGEFVMAIRLDPIPSWTRAYDLASSSLAQSWTGNVDALELVQHWLLDCLRNHSSCGAPFHSESPWRPTRLLEISEHTVRLVMTNEEGVRGAYATISHCWGTERFPTLTSASLAEFTSGISRTELPRSFQEAMETTETLGIRYLWIDCYCIIQDDQSDWLSEAPLMSKVYSNSQINIGAADASGPRQGMFRERPINSIIIRPEPSSGMECMAYRLVKKDGRAQFDGGLFNDPLDRAFESKVLRESALMTRAWVLQERALSRRMVTFTREEIYWQCHESAATESYPVGWPKASIERLIDDPFWSLSPSQSLLRNVRRGPNRHTESSHHDDPVLEPRPVTYQERWFNALSSYNAAKLTYPAKDKILAIDGIGMRLAELSNDAYSRGILAKTMPYALLWENKELHAQEPSNNLIQESQYPSWHWASGTTANFDKGTHWNYTILRSGHSWTGPQTYCFTSETGLRVANEHDLDYWPRLYCIGRPQKATLVNITKSHGCQFELASGTTIRASVKWDDVAANAAKMGGRMYLLPVTHTLMSCATGYLDARNNMGLVLVSGRRSSGAFRRVGIFSEAWVTDRCTIYNNGKTVKPQLIIIE